MADALDPLARRRPVTLAVVGWRHEPGLCVTPWVLRGLLDALAERDLGTGPVLPLGEPDAVEPSLERARRQEPLRPLGGGLRIRVAMTEGGRRVAAPRSLVGNHLLLVAPLAHRRVRGRMFAPATGALDALGHALGIEGSGEADRRSVQQAVGELFASATLVLDATWWSACDERAQLLAEPVPVDHLVGTPDLADPLASAHIDRWINHHLGIDRSRRGESLPALRLQGRRGAWPQVRLAAGGARGLATRAVGAVYRSIRLADRGNARQAALTPEVPGRFSSEWKSWRAVSLFPTQ